MTRYLTAPTTPGDREDDFAHTIPGELLTLDTPCDNPRCDCRRSFAGLSSRKGTSTATITEVPIHLDVIADLAMHVFASSYEISLEDLDLADFQAGAHHLSQAATLHPIGATVRRTDLDQEQA